MRRLRACGQIREVSIYGNVSYNHKKPLVGILDVAL